MAVKLSQLGAVLIIVQAARDNSESTRAGYAHYKRVHRAIDALGMCGESREQIMRALEYHDDYGRPYRWLAKHIPA